MTIILFLAVLSVLVVVHELGHFLAARLFGVGVEEFGLGFPPRLLGWFRNGRHHWRTVGWRTRRRRHHTIFSLNWIPLGGFVRLRGEEGIRWPGDKTNFANKTIGQRAVIIVAGVVMNIVLATVLFIGGLTIGWPQATDNLHSGARVISRQVAVIEVLPDSPAKQAGLQPGDAIVQAGGLAVESIAGLRLINSDSAGQPVNYQISRQSKMINLAIAPKPMEISSGQYGIGVALAESGLVAYRWPQAVWEGLSLTANNLKDIAVGFWYLSAGLFQGQDMSDQVAGPVGIAVLTGQISHLGWIYLLQFIALLSLNLAFINILPLPALDGGRLFFIVLEKITGRPTRANLEVAIHNIGFILLLALVIFITFQDVGRLIK
jgi:regulator of sigma E protease